MNVRILGPRFHHFNASIERAFRQLGHETRVLAYDNPIHPYTFANKVRFKFSLDKTTLRRRSRTEFSLMADRVFDLFRPDLVFVMNGDMLHHMTIERWRGRRNAGPVQHTAKVVVWFFDSYTHIPLCEENIKSYNAIFCYEQTDLPLLRSRFGETAYFLPQAVDTTLYHPMPTPKDYDIVFAGDIYHSAKRKAIIQAVVARYPHLRIRVWGEYKPWYKNPLRWLLRERRDVYQNRNASSEQLCLDYNRARIVLNVHIEQQQDGANPKVYEICGTGAYQICDANPYIEQLFTDGEVGLYHNEEELFALIDDALAHDHSALARQAYERVLNGNTFVDRIRQVLDVVGNLTDC